MIFEFAVGSKGTPYPAYSIRIPVMPGPGQRLEIGDGVCFKLDNLRVEIAVERFFYSLTVSEFASESEAAQWLTKFSLALLSATAKLRFGLTFVAEAEPIKLYDEAIALAPNSLFIEVLAGVGWQEIDGFYNAETRPKGPSLSLIVSRTFPRTSGRGVSTSSRLAANREKRRLQV